MAFNHFQSHGPTTSGQIQAIFNETITKIINLVETSTNTTSIPTTNTTNEGVEPCKMANPPKDNKNLSADLIPILQTFLLNVHIYHTTTFNGIINGISAVVPEQSLITRGDICQPSVSHKWQTQHENISNSNINVLENELAGFAAMELNDSRPINFLGKSEYQPRSTASQETRHFWAKEKPITQQTYNSPPPNYIQANQSNYDDFLKHYTDEFAKYHTTYVDDSSDGENENTWQSLSEYVSEMTPGVSDKKEQSAEQLSEFQCCARLSKYMKYRIADLDDDFVKSYPPDTYIEGGFVFGKPCINRVIQSAVDKGNYLCSDHINDVGIEDIRQPRPEIHRPTEDDVEIIFSNKGYYTGRGLEKKDEWEGFDYYSDYDPNHYKRQLPSTGSTDAFSRNYQCCARLNKFRLYRLELESDKFLDTYPDDVYIEDGCVYGTACQNLISDESYSAGIRFCVEHESDPYVENICEPMVINSKLPKYHASNLQIKQNPQNNMNSSSHTVANTTNIETDTSTRTVRRSARLNQTGSYEWDKYNTDFNYLC